MKDSQFLVKIKNFFINLILPTKCLGCHSPEQILCPNCVTKIRLTERETPKNITAVFDYRDPLIKKAIWELKYYHKRYLGEKLGLLLYESLIEDIAELKINVFGRPLLVIPTPISHKKMLMRGYNQTESIARGFCRCEKPNIFELKNNILYKKIENQPQAKIINRLKRLKNTRNVFAIKNSESIKGRTIIVIDDVTTTGGTLSEIIKTLKKSGAKKVVGFAVAH